MAIDGRASTRGEPEAVDPTIIPALFEHAVKVFELMWKRSKPEQLSASSSDGKTVRVYEGHYTKLFDELLLSVPYYTSIKNQLVGMGCIEQLRRGGGNATSRWILWKPPELEAWKAYTPRKARRGNATQMIQGNVKDLHDRVTRLEELVEFLMRRERVE